MTDPTTDPTARARQAIERQGAHYIYAELSHDMQLLIAGFEAAEARIAELEGALQGCLSVLEPDAADFYPESLVIIDDARAVLEEPTDG